jgi:hypothetical protein
MPRLDNCERKIYNISIENLKKACESLHEIFPEFYHEAYEPYSFSEVQDNPNPEDEDDDFILVPITADYAIKFVLKNIAHRNFNFEVLLLNNTLYITNSVYQYGNYASDKLYKLISDRLLLKDNLFTYPSYKLWVDYQKDSRDAIHNYKIDQEDLLKINIKV